MLGGVVSLCSLAMCLRTISEYRKRSPQMRQCHWSRAKMYGRHSELFGSSLGSGIVLTIQLLAGVSYCRHAAPARVDHSMLRSAPNRAITLSRKDWHSSANRAVL